MRAKKKYYKSAEKVALRLKYDSFFKSEKYARNYI